MLSIGWGEMVVIGLIALVVVGPDRWPEMARTLGQYYGKFRRVVNEAQQNIAAEADLFSALTKPELPKEDSNIPTEPNALSAPSEPELSQNDVKILAGVDSVGTQAYFKPVQEESAPPRTTPPDSSPFSGQSNKP